MKKIILILLLIMPLTKINSQRNVFVLVDVSGSYRNNNIRSQAKNIVSQLLLGNLNLNSFSGWSTFQIADAEIENIINGSRQGLIENGSYICIMPFGNLERYQNYSITQIYQFPNDLINFYNQNYPESFSDGLTYIQIAQAYTTYMASEKNFSEYYIVTVSDRLGDQENTSSQNLYSQEETELLLSWNNRNLSTVESVGSLQTNGYYIHLQKVQLRNIQTQTPNQTPKCELKLLTFQGGTKGNERKVKSGNITFQWNCKDCQNVTEFYINIMNLDGNRQNNLKRPTRSKSFTSNLKDGKYKIQVSAKDCKSDKTYIEVNTGGGFGILLILIIAALGGGGFLYWKNLRDKKLKKISRKEEPTSDSLENEQGGIF